MESFFALVQKNVLDCQRWANRHELRALQKALRLPFLKPDNGDP